MTTRIQVALDCADPDRVARFWADALGYRMQPPPAGYPSWPEYLEAAGVPPEKWNSASAVVDPEGVGPRLFFQQVPEAKAGKNRMHLDLNVGGGAGTPPQDRIGRVTAEVARLVGLGATRVGEVRHDNEFWVVMQDPEGNEFCVQ
jgi:catechol 2,3-dioxygenase-like lactoylglutathione lyase family enzyme